ncbi:MAG: trehalose-phosphatase [Steroidobacter sp.]
MPGTAIHDRGWALFLDVDGTLLEIAPTPQAVHVPESLKLLLNTLCVRLDGALALISGRSIENLDQLFAPHRYCASGVHGCERRVASGAMLRPEISARSLATARSALTAFVQAREGLLLEDKGYGLAVHFRLAPHLHDEVHEQMAVMLQHLGPDFRLQAGKFVFEIRPAHWSKGTSVSAFMQEPPFLDRRPVFIGDDVTDEDAFGAVNALDGVSVRVGEASNTIAKYRLAGVAAVHRWLTTFPPPEFAALGP